MRTLGLDVGDKRIGVALSDPEGILASPLTIIEHTNDDADVKAIADIVVKQGAGMVIVGLPRSMSGAVGEQAEKVKTFAGKLGAVIKVPLEFRDERLSTVPRNASCAKPGQKSRRVAGRRSAATPSPPLLFCRVTSMKCTTATSNFYRYRSSGNFFRSHRQ